MDVAVPADHRIKLKEIEKRDKYLDLEKLKKTTTMEHVSESDTNCNWCFWYSHQSICTGTGGLWNKGTNGDHTNYGIVEIG